MSSQCRLRPITISFAQLGHGYDMLFVCISSSVAWNSCVTVIGPENQRHKQTMDSRIKRVGALANSDMSPPLNLEKRLTNSTPGPVLKRVGLHRATGLEIVGKQRENKTKTIENSQKAN